MTQEQVTKHKDVIKWWLDNTDKGVWYADTFGVWEKAISPSWNINYIYVQNDEYAELRKKICDLESELNRLKGQIR